MFHVIENANLIVKLALQIKNGIMIYANDGVTSKYRTLKKDYSYISSKCIWENGMYLKSIVDKSIIESDEIINATASESRNLKNILTTNVTNTIPTVL